MVHNIRKGKQDFTLKNSYLFKFSCMLILLGADLALNSSLEYDLYRQNEEIALIMFGIHVIVQILTFLTLFLMLCDTYLFRVGLLGILFSHFRQVLLMYPVYIVSTILLGGFRLRYILDGNKLWDIHRILPFFASSSIHKFLAVIFYLLNTRAALKLADPNFYEKDQWVQLYYEHLDRIGPNLY